MSFQTLSTVFREEREEILSGKSLKSLIQKRVQRRKEEQQRFQQLLSALEGFKEGKYSTEQTIRFVEKSYIRGTLLQFLLDLIEQRAHNTDRIASLKKKCQDYGWI
jgi:chorismate mutase